MVNAIALYLRSVAAAVRVQLQYPTSFVLLLVGQLIGTGTEFLAMWILFERFGTIDGWTLPEVSLLYGMANVAFALAEGGGRGLNQFDVMMRSGDFDRVLLRPRSTVLQLAMNDLQPIRGRTVQGLAVLVYALIVIAPGWSFAQVLLFVAAIVTGVVVFLGVFLLRATLSFWTVESVEIINVLSFGGVETTQYPLSIYDPWLRNLFVYVIPLGCMNYFPALVLLGRDDVMGLPAWMPWVSPLVGVAFFAVCVQVWRFGVRHYRSTGS